MIIDRRCCIRIAAASAMLALYIAVMPVCVVRGKLRGGEEVFAVPCALGAPFTTRYIHSVARTPVEDEYRVLEGSLWGWEERISSHGAGLPYDAPPGGSFVVEDGVMKVRGGRVAHRVIAHRVGTGDLGANVFCAAPFGEEKVYLTLSGELVLLSAGEVPMFALRTTWPPRINR